jgi:hypothetical protein
MIGKGLSTRLPALSSVVSKELHRASLGGISSSPSGRPAAFPVCDIDVAKHLLSLPMNKVNCISMKILIRASFFVMEMIKIGALLVLRDVLQSSQTGRFVIRPLWLLDPGKERGADRQ